MDRTTIGLLGALGALVAGTQAQAAIPSPSSAQVLAASSYAELLQPIPNALETLNALDAPSGTVEDVQYYPYYYAPRPQPYYRRFYHHHHHRYYHHHHHNYHHHHGYHRHRR